MGCDAEPGGRDGAADDKELVRASRYKAERCEGRGGLAGQDSSPADQYQL